MSLNSIINTSLSGLFTNQQSMQVTSNNIANVNTPGYGRLQVNQSANLYQGESAGVKIDGVTRVVDNFLEAAFRVSNSNASEFTAGREFHDRIQGLLGDPSAESSLSTRLGDIYSSIADMSLNPADVLRRQQTLNEMQSYMDNISLIQSEVQNLRGEAGQQLNEKVEDVNELLSRIFELNPLIAKASLESNNAGSLEGEMSQVLDRLSDLIDINVTRNTEGSFRVATSSGVTLIDKTTKSELDFDTPGIVDANTYFEPITLYRLDQNTDERISSGRSMSGQIRSGRIKGLIDIRDEQLVNLSETMGELGARFRDAINSVHNKFSAVPAPNDLTGKQTYIDNSQSVNFTGKVTFAVTDSASSLIASHEVDFDTTSFSDYDALISNVNAGLSGVGTLSLSNGVMSMQAANSSHGVVIAQDETAPSNSGNRGFAHYFGMNDLISSQSEGIYNTGLTGSDPHTMTVGETMQFRVLDRNNSELSTVTVNVAGSSIDDMLAELNDVTGLGGFVNFALDSSGKMDWTSTGIVDGVDIQLIKDNTEMGATGVGFAAAFGMDKSYQINAALNMEVKSNVADDPSLLSVSLFDFSASVGSTVLTSGDQRGALAFQDTETKVYEFANAGELKATDVTLGQYLSQFLGNTGLMAQRAENMEIDNLALQNELSARRSNVNGVNLDEELSNLIVYQNAYSASARVLSSVQELYDTLLAAV